MFVPKDVDNGYLSLRNLRTLYSEKQGVGHNSGSTSLVLLVQVHGHLTFVFRLFSFAFVFFTFVIDPSLALLQSVRQQERRSIKTAMNLIKLRYVGSTLTSDLHMA